ATKNITCDVETKSGVRFRPSSAGDSDATLTCEGVMCASAAFKVTKAGHLPLEVESYLPGSVTVEGQKVTVGPGKKAAVDLDLLPKIAGANIASSDKISVAIAFEADGGKGAETLTLSGPAVTELVARKLGEVERGPLALPGEGAAPPEPGSMIV